MGAEFGDNCNIKPSTNEDIAIFDKGKQMGEQLRQGDSDRALDAIQSELEQWFVKGIPQAQRLQKSNLMLSGMACTDPTDLHPKIGQHDLGNFYVDVDAESGVNTAFKTLAEYHSNPQLAMVAANYILSNLWTGESDKEKSIVSRDFVLDFNRRKLEKNEFLSFEAYLDSSGLAKVRLIPGKDI
jgi:hypothetical protein